ncbi:DivIVA domain-containing protein [Nocardioides bruguierae]|uniref:DivIVA domain-containing protein n=1 Tax=Nocardioides bruguierae TaxID=2945102 RepID=UPI00202007F6|nr:DivIVA domain-containing protein [Nocardioides bruguierae]MCL8025701.1 DivIVA domain-containing protein [Nocardioides bruguierae]
MMWFLAALVVLAMGGVALLAAGKGEPLAPAFDDRPDASVPAGEVTGDDLRRVRFSLAFRGYRMSEVDALLDRLATERDQARAAQVETDEGPQRDPDDPDPADGPTSPLQGG